MFVVAKSTSQGVLVLDLDGFTRGPCVSVCGCGFASFVVAKATSRQGTLNFVVAVSTRQQGEVNFAFNSKQISAGSWGLENSAQHCADYPCKCKTATR